MQRLSSFRSMLLLSLCLFATASSVVQAAPDPAMEKAKQAVVKGLNYLRTTQEKDGSWNEYSGTTSLALCAFLHNGRNEVNEPAVARGVRFLIAAAKPNGAIYSEGDTATALPNYNTAVALMALALTKNSAYKPILQKAQKYLEGSQLDEAQGVSPTDHAYGGIGYGSHIDRPDLSNLSMALQGLKESGVPPSAPVFQKAIIFLQRVQNRVESNDQAWVKDGPQDGGFVYDSTGRTHVEGKNEHASFGSMTYAGLESYIYAGVSKTDPRTLAAWDWIRGNYTVSEHPGMGNVSLYYYYHAMAKTLSLYGQKIVKDKSGKPHNWASDLATQIVSVQHPDGSWYNDNARYWENQPGLVTSYSLIALSYCLK